MTTNTTYKYDSLYTDTCEWFVSVRAILDLMDENPKASNEELMDIAMGWYADELDEYEPRSWDILFTQICVLKEVQ